MVVFQVGVNSSESVVEERCVRNFKTVVGKKGYVEAIDAVMTV